MEPGGWRLVSGDGAVESYNSLRTSAKRCWPPVPCASLAQGSTWTEEASTTCTQPRPHHHSQRAHFGRPPEPDSPPFHARPCATLAAHGRDGLLLITLHRTQAYHPTPHTPCPTQRAARPTSLPAQPAASSRASSPMARRHRLAAQTPPHHPQCTLSHMPPFVCPTVSDVPFTALRCPPSSAHATCPISLYGTSRSALHAPRPAHPWPGGTGWPPPRRTCARHAPAP